MMTDESKSEQERRKFVRLDLTENVRAVDAAGQVDPHRLLDRVVGLALEHLRQGADDERHGAGPALARVEDEQRS